MKTAFEKLYAGCKRAKEELAKERPHLDDEDKAELGNLVRAAKGSDGLLVRLLSDYETDIFACPRCQTILTWRDGVVIKDFDGGAITVCPPCADARSDFEDVK